MYFSEKTWNQSLWSIRLHHTMGTGADGTHSASVQATLSSASAPIPWLFSLPGPLGRHLPSILSFSMKTDFPSTPQSWPPPPCLHWAVENASPFPSSSLLLTGSPSRKGPRFISDSSVLHTGLELGAVQWLDLVIPSHGAAGKQTERRVTCSGSRASLSAGVCPWTSVFLILK